MITVQQWGAGPCTTWRKRFWPSAPTSIPAIISHLCVISIPHQTNMWLWPKEAMPSKPAEGEFWASRSNVVGVSSPPPQWNPLWWICNEHNLQDVILILYLSAFVCKLSIMVKKKRKKNPACICSWFCHEMTLPNVWYCFLYWKRKKYTTVDALRLCYKSFFWTAFCIFEHNCIACLAAVIDSPEVWLDVNSDLLCCFVSFLILRHLTASYWFVECMTVNALSPIII